MRRDSRKRPRETALRRQPGRLRGGFFLALFLHSGFLSPLIFAAFFFGGREEQQRENQVEVTFQTIDPKDIPADLPPIEQVREPETPKAAKKKPDRLAQAEPAPEPQPETPKPDEPPPPLAPLPPPPKDKPGAKAVELDDDVKETEPAPDAKFLADKSVRVKEETRATETNLEKSQNGEQGSTPSDRKDDHAGDDENRIAQLEDQKSKQGRQAPEVTPHRDPTVSSGSGAKSPSLLSMRETMQLKHAFTPETFDPSLPRDPSSAKNVVPLEGVQGLEEKLGQGDNDARMKLALSAKDLRYLAGLDADAAERLAQTQKSKRAGKYEQRWGRVRSALENFIPEVKPGNQTALNTRAAPFATFIARMHRTIHQLWGFGFLEDMDRKGASNPYNDRNLATKLEIVLNGDGTVDKVGIIRSSGYLPFDVAAVDVAYSAGPYADPPPAIRSKNGKIYVHWSFHRDERQCSTANTEYFILDNAPAGGDTGEDDGHAHGLPAPPPPPTGPKRLHREIPNTPEARAKMRELDEAAGDTGGERQPTAAQRAAEQVARADDPAARAMANTWFDAFARGDTARMVKQATFPFRSAGGVAAKDARELRSLLTALMEESSKRKLAALEVYSPAGARGALGGLPPGFDDGEAVLFAVGRTGEGTFVLAMESKAGAWRAVGLVRR